MIVEWNPERPKKKISDLIVSTLKEGGIIAYPTDTYYGIGCDLFNIKSIRKLYAMKHLDEKSRLSIICRDMKDKRLCGPDDFSFDIVKWYLPGPFTFVLRARKIIPKLLMTDRKEVGVRIPAHPVPVGIAGLCPPFSFCHRRRGHRLRVRHALQGTRRRGDDARGIAPAYATETTRSPRRSSGSSRRERSDS